MTTKLLKPQKLTGVVRVPASKSIGHRLLICAGLADGRSILKGVTSSDDITATLTGMRCLGAEIEEQGSTLVVKGSGGVRPLQQLIDCGESGSTLRFLLPLALTAASKLTFTGQGRLGERPLTVYEAICREQGLMWQSDGGLPLTVCGPLEPGSYKLPGDISSQFLSGLLFALPLLGADSVIELTTPLESKGYVDLTLAALADAGIVVEHEAYRRFSIWGRQAYRPIVETVEGDFSQAAFWLVAGTIGTAISCEGLNPHSRQGDRAIVDWIRAAGGVINYSDQAITAVPAPTAETVIDASNCPDLVPIMAVLASVSRGETRIIRAGRLRLKESDRLRSTSTELRKLGADIIEGEDSLIIRGKPWLNGGEVDSWQDHRIAMALAIASIRCQQPVLLHGSDCVAKSYPDFWRDFVKLGGVIDGGSLG